LQAIGILGGTFNPIHLGHTHVAQAMMQRLSLDKVLFIPAALPALKQSPQIDTQQRLDMLALAIQGHPLWQIDTREIDRGGISYSIDTLKSLREELGSDCSLVWLLGSDAFARIDQWHDWQALLDYAHFAIATRPNINNQYSEKVTALLKQHSTDEPHQLKLKSHGCIVSLEINAPDISSSAIRHAVSQGVAVNDLLNPAVCKYIHQENLYR
jgi:nicotinate-nucleotide adenylyltransferase